MPMMVKRLSWRTLWLLGVLLLYLGLASYQLGLPGLHYDEAAEAGVNAMQLLTGAPVTAFRDSALSLFGWRLPLMVQDYIGALNVYLALPVLSLTGIGVPNLRSIAILSGLCTLLLLERTLTEWCTGWGAPPGASTRPEAERSERTPGATSLAPYLALTLLAASPSFVFWSRQGIFVTNLIQPLCLLCLWVGLRWLRTGRPLLLILSALAGGLAVYAKLLALWVIGPFVLLAGGWWLSRWFSRGEGWAGNQPNYAASARLAAPPALPWWLILATVGAFTLGLAPLLLFNLQTGGVGQGVFSRLDQSYYGVNNRDLLPNATVRWGQLLQTLRGDHLWYLGGVYGNPLAPWLGIGAVLFGLGRRWRWLLAPLLLLLLTCLCSLVTISDLFITHYALVQPLAVAVIALGLSTLGEWPRKLQSATTLVHSPGRQGLLLLFVGLWLAADLSATVRYHAALTRSGGLADHAEASYQLAYYLRYHGLGAPLVLDWGIAAPVRYLSEGTVTPIELFGYRDLHQPDPEFGQQLMPFLANPANVYLLHAPAQTVFHGRREALEAASQQQGLRLILEERFTQRDGVPLVEIWRVVR